MKRASRSTRANGITTLIQLPVVRKDKQRRPAVTEAELAEILSDVKKRKYVVLFALLAGTGLRIGEALALRSTT
jgi:integrase